MTVGGEEPVAERTAGGDWVEGESVDVGTIDVGGAVVADSARPGTVVAGTSGTEGVATLGTGRRVEQQ